MSDKSRNKSRRQQKKVQSKEQKARHHSFLRQGWGGGGARASRHPFELKVHGEHGLDASTLAKDQWDSL